MNITVTTAGNILPAGATVSNVEIININQSQASATNITSANFAGVQQLWQIDTSAAGGTFQNTSVSTGVTAGFRGDGQALNVNVNQLSGNSVSVALDGVASGATVQFVEGTAGTVRTANVSGSVAGAGVVTLDAFGGGTTALNTFNVSLSSASNVTIQNAGGQTQTANFGGRPARSRSISTTSRA